MGMRGGTDLLNKSVRNSTGLRPACVKGNIKALCVGIVLVRLNNGGDKKKVVALSGRSDYKWAVKKGNRVSARGDIVPLQKGIC